MAVPGIDIASYQGTPDWPAVQASDVRFVICKATEGDGSFVDSKFADDWAKLRNTTLRQGAYHFGRPDLGNSPEVEADGFLAEVRAAGWLVPGQGDLLALDLEATNAQGNLHDWALRWLQRVEAAVGFKPLFYSYPSYMIQHGLLGPDLGQYGLWIAGDQPSVLSGWDFYAIWQTTQGRNVPGISGTVDADSFNGDEPALLRYGFQPPPDPAVPVNPSPVPDPQPAPPAPAPAPTPPPDPILHRLDALEAWASNIGFKK